MKKATKQKFALAVTLGPVLPLIVFLNWDRFKSSSLTEMLIAVAVSLVAWAWLNVLFFRTDWRLAIEILRSIRH